MKNKGERIKDIIGKAFQDVRTISLVGYLAKEDENQVWIQDREGTWIIDKSDVVGIKEHEPKVKGFGSKAVCAFIRDGAEIYEMRPWKIDLNAKPITICDPKSLPDVIGQKELRSLGNQWRRHVGLKAARKADCTTECTPYTSTCEVDLPGGGTEFLADDSECDWVDIC